MRRQQLTETQIAALFDPPTDPRGLIRHYTLSAGDLATIHQCRGEHNRLGRALMLCYLRYPGRPLRAGERPPAVLTAFAWHSRSTLFLRRWRRAGGLIDERGTGRSRCAVRHSSWQAASSRSPTS
jgi:Domain of unknown function (DUF4158)